MDNFTRTELEEAKYSIESTVHKCEKALGKLKQGTPQRTLTDRRIKAFRLSLALIERELEKPEFADNENDSEEVR